MTTPRDLIAASSPSYPGLMLGHADEILARLTDAGWELVRLGDPPPPLAPGAEGVVRQRLNGVLVDIPVRRAPVKLTISDADLAALGEPEAKEDL